MNINYPIAHGTLEARCELVAKRLYRLATDTDKTDRDTADKIHALAQLLDSSIGLARQKGADAWQRKLEGQ